MSNKKRDDSNFHKCFFLNTEMTFFLTRHQLHYSWKERAEFPSVTLVRRGTSVNSYLFLGSVKCQLSLRR